MVSCGPRSVGVFLAAIVMISSALSAQAPASTPPVTLEQLMQAKTELERQAFISGLVNRATSCEAKMLDLAALKARVAQLEALEKKPETPSTDPTKPKD